MMVCIDSWSLHELCMNSQLNYFSWYVLLCYSAVIMIHDAVYIDTNYM